MITDESGSDSIADPQHHSFDAGLRSPDRGRRGCGQVHAGSQKVPGELERGHRLSQYQHLRQRAGFRGLPFVFISNPLLQKPLGFKHPRDCFVRGRSHRRKMTHLATLTRLMFFVEMQAHSGHSKRQIEPGISFEPDIAEQVGDRGGLHDADVAERQIADRADCLLELAGDAGAFAGVVAVVRARGEFVDKQCSLCGEEHFDREQALKFELIGQSQGELPGRFAPVRRGSRRGSRSRQGSGFRDDWRRKGSS